MEFSGSRIVVTGASRGLGEIIAKQLAERGARVVLVARSKDAIDKLAADLGGEAYAADLGDPAQLDGLVARIEADGPIDALVNNAGVDTVALLHEICEDDVRTLIAINLVAPMIMSRAV